MALALSRHDRWRRIQSTLVVWACAGAVLLALVPLAMVLFYLLSRGVSSINANFFTQMPKPVGETGGGMSNAIVGTSILLSLAALIGVPIGITCAVYLAEYPKSRFSLWARFAADVLNGVPSIVIGIFAYSLAV